MSVCPMMEKKICFLPFRYLENFGSELHKCNLTAESPDPKH